MGLVDACRTMPRLVMFSATCARHSSSNLRSHQAHVRLARDVYCCCGEHNKRYIKVLLVCTEQSRHCSEQYNSYT